MPSGVASKAAESLDYGVGGFVRDCRPDADVQLDKVNLVSFNDAELGQTEGQWLVLEIAVARLSFRWNDVLDLLARSTTPVDLRVVCKGGSGGSAAGDRDVCTQTSR